MLRNLLLIARCASGFVCLSFAIFRWREAGSCSMLWLDLGKSQQQRNQNMSTRNADEIAESTEKLLNDLKAVVHDGEELLQAGMHELSDRGQAARERLASALDSAKETGRKLQERAVAGAKVTDRAIREHPYQTIGIAFGLGVLIGVLVARR
jgi:ElaB/YqjD/DUF883 family membrane-anchored ribosome-binding protein